MQNKPRNDEQSSALIMAGGTGGHVYPAIAIADELQKKGFNICWLGTARGFEAKVVAEKNYSFYPITISGLRGKGLTRFLIMPWQLLQSFCQSFTILKKVDPKFVLGMGGYVSGPGAIAAWLLRKPIIIHEQNAIPGFTNRLLSKIAKRTLESYPQSFKPAKNLVFSGNPVRKEILALESPEQRFRNRDTNKFRLLVLGGSLGAKFINEMVPRSITKAMQQNGLEVWHQTGTKLYDEVVQSYQDIGLTAKVDPFIEKMEEAYQWADLVIARAGATTVAEIAAVGLGSILIPYPYAVDDHQTKNAQVLELNHAAILMQQRELSEMKLQKLLEGFQSKRQSLRDMAMAAQKVANLDALETILEQCLGVCREERD